MPPSSPRPAPALVFIGDRIVREDHPFTNRGIGLLCRAEILGPFLFDARMSNRRKEKRQTKACAIAGRSGIPMTGGGRQNALQPFAILPHPDEFAPMDTLPLSVLVRVDR